MRLRTGTGPRFVRRLAGVLLGLTVSVSVPAQAPEARTPEVRESLDRIRESLVQMHFDEALAAIEAVLARPALTETERGDALVLRAQAHAAFGDLDAVERDYSEILHLRPGYVPDPSLTPAKAQQRFEKVRAKTVGEVELTLDPRDATLFVDGREAGPPGPGGKLWLLAGSRTLRAERRGHDPAEQAVEVAAGKSVAVSLSLLPNARTVVLRTEPAGVRVAIDGRPAGETRSEEGSIGAGAPEAELVVEDLPLGEHVFELSKECYRAERMTDTLAVDLLDRSPKRYQVVRMAPARTPLVLKRGPAGAEVRVDGKPLGRLPAESLEACPGPREIAVVFRGRVVWSVQAELAESVEAAFDVEPRPNAALVGSEAWPPELRDFGAGFNTIARLERRAGADLSDAHAWDELDLPEHVDLALGVVRGERPGAADRWYLYSPILLAVTPLAAPPAHERPAWTLAAWGLGVVDSETGGPARVVHVRTGGPAASAGLVPGDRVLEVGGRAVASARDVQATLDGARPDRPIRIKWRSAAAGDREAELSGRASPRLGSGDERPEAAAVRAAWAVVDALVRPDEAPSALANLGILLYEFDHDDLAADVWRRVDWGSRAGVGEGTKQYYLGRLLERLGREADAAEAYRRAARSESTAFTDDGPPIALAARDRLADLGVAQEGRAPSAR